MKYFISLFILVVLGCTFHNKETNESNQKNKFTTPKTLSVSGDFDGDGRQDTLMQFLADSTGKRVDKLPQFENKTWEEIVEYYDKQGYYTAIAMSNKTTDTLTFTHSQGLYCLINLGDLNSDRHDEIALVTDRMDFSRHNYCYIYSWCNAGWKELFKFNVHEGVFDYEETSVIFKDIPEALEYRKGEWRFYDYLDMEYETEEEVGQMQSLIVESCN